MADRREDPAVERVWQEFHTSVNMSGHELRTWLLTQASDETAFQAGPDPGLPTPGREVVDVLTKRRRDLTDADVAVMERVAAEIADLRTDPPPEGVQDAGWRHELMNRGHDPLRESPAQEAAWPPA